MLEQEMAWQTQSVLLGTKRLNGLETIEKISCYHSRTFCSDVCEHEGNSQEKYIVELTYFFEIDIRPLQSKILAIVSIKR